MTKHGPTLPSAVLTAALVVLATASVSVAAPLASSTATASSASSARLELAQHEENSPRELEPRYEPARPRPANSYNDEYIFGLTRGVADSTMHPAVKILIFPITVPLDFVLLPFELIGGVF